MINLLFKKTILALMAATLAFAALPMASVYAQDENPPAKVVSTEKLEKAWAHQMALYGRLGRAFEDTASRLAQVQALIDKATAKGRDTAAVQSALNVFSAAVEKSRSIYDAVKVLITTHAGFDANGKVIDATQAQATIQSVHAKLQELKVSMDGSGKALREAIQAFRAANKPVEGTPPSKDP